MTPARLTHSVCNVSKVLSVFYCTHLHEHLFLHQEKETYFGAIVGRCANRIAGGQFQLSDRKFRLATNNGPNALHGGVQGWDKRLWLGQRIAHAEGEAVRLTYTSSDGEEVRKHLSPRL